MVRKSAKTADIVIFGNEGIRRIDEHDEAVIITRAEGKRLNLSVAQVKEVLSLHYRHLARVWESDAIAVITTITSHRRKRKRG
jgi:hypothetical protein